MLERILRDVGEASKQLGGGKLCAFDTVVGGAYKGDLLVVGRAVNGWEDEGWLAEEARSEAFRAEKSRELSATPADNESCPMQWVSDMAGSAQGYNTNRSAFWRTVRSVTQRLNIEGESGGSWASVLAWTNLYRVSPASAGNPSARLASIQRDGCIEALGATIDQLSPRRILFLTGWDWAGDFVKFIGSWSPAFSKAGLVESGGYLRRKGQEYSVVIAKHPQGKPEKEMVDAIMSSWS